MKEVAYVGKIIAIEPIEKADRLVSATVVCGNGGRWVGVVAKDGFVVGELVNVYLQDAVLPDRPEFEFMRKHGFRVKISKFRGANSECLITKLQYGATVGEAVTEISGATKHEKPLPTGAGNIIGHFLPFVPKTDELHVQAVPHFVRALRRNHIYITVKYDGTSMTVGRHPDTNEFGVYSRNYRLEETGNMYARAVEKYGLDKLPQGIFVQCELYGLGINGNALMEKDHKIAVFDVFDANQREYLGFYQMTDFLRAYNLPMAKVLCLGPVGIMGVNKWRELARGKYPNGTDREGIVVRPVHTTRVNGERVSFKVINPDYE